jgi:MFS family permease
MHLRERRSRCLPLRGFCFYGRYANVYFDPHIKKSMLRVVVAMNKQTVFGMSQFLFQTPAGYLYDYTEQKVLWLSIAGMATTALTLLTAFFAQPMGGNLALMVFIKFIQGAVTSFIPPGLNSITQGIVGANGMTSQVSVNEMMNHLGTAVIVLTGSLVGVWLYPNLGMLFVVSPIACAGFLFFLNRIRPDDIDHNAARGLERSDSLPPISPSTTGDEYKKSGSAADLQSPSFNFYSTAGSTRNKAHVEPKADSPFRVLRDPILLVFLGIVFLFHTANGTVLPLVMQTLALGSGRTGILMSGLCIIVAQIFMVGSAKVCGDYSGQYGRKGLFLLGLLSVPVRCIILTGLLVLRGDDQPTSNWMQAIILSTQILDGVGAGVFGTMYILVTSDISGGTGRFSMILGLTTAACSIGGTVSGYLGQALAQDLGYKQAFFILAIMSLVPALLYLVFMPETLPAMVKQQNTTTTGASSSGRSSGKVGTFESIQEGNEPVTSYGQMA